MDKVKPNDLTSKDVGDFGKEVGRETVKQALVWTVASLMTKGMRQVIDRLMKNE